MIAIMNKCAVAPTKVFTLSEVTRHIQKQLAESPERVSGTIDSTVERLWKKGYPVNAIMVLRFIYPLGIKEAKEYCEAQWGPNPAFLHD